MRRLTLDYGAGFFAAFVSERALIRTEISEAWTNDWVWGALVLFAALR
jgi:hypothetical protein